MLENTMGEPAKTKTFHRLLQFLRPHYRTVAVGLAALIGTTLLQLVPQQIHRNIVDVVFGNPRHLPQPVQMRDLAVRCMLLGLIHLGVAGLNRTRSVVMHVLGEKFILDLRRMMYSHLQKMSLTYYETRQTGEIMSRVTNDSEVVEEFVTHATDTLIGDSLTVVAITVILFWMNVPMALVAMIPVPVLGFITFRYSRKVRRFYRSTRERLADMNAKLQDNLSGIRVIKSFAREEHEYNRFAAEAEEFYDIRVNVIKLWTLFMPLTQLAVSLGGVVLWWYGGTLITHQQVTLGTVIAFVGYLWMFYGPVNNIARVSDTIQRSLAAAERIFEVLDTEPDLADSPNAVQMPDIEGRVEFENVSFRYSSGEEVLKEIGITAKPGQIVALVGRSGAGKSSIVNLIPRFYDTTSGRVLVDGVDVRTVTQESLRRQIGIVLQDTFLFNGTIRENILYGRLGASDDEVLEAAKAANADEFIQYMPEGYDTLIGERGIKLSGGQRQRLAIARAILADPRILILDEATSSVDSESEYLIHKAMDEMMKGRTTFVIAHRLSTIKHADMIITLEDGRIVEVGDHRSLLEKDGVYSQMYEAQFRLHGES
jgi:subfamily B ATP-binding cassette protein MsbA